MLSLSEVEEILGCFRDREKVEISFECNPEDITSEYVSGLFQLGITRLSIGIQSLNDDTLKAIHRSDRASISHALDAIDTTLCTLTLHSALSINIDFILGLPYSRP